MASVKVTSIIDRAERILNDAGAIRWPRVELQAWLNDAYREIVILRPDANAKTATVTLAAGTRQKLYDAASINLPLAIRLLDVVRNMAATSRKRAISLADRHVMDDLVPDWHSVAASINVASWMFDLRVPKEFLVYPPATATAQVEIAYSSVPVQHALTELALDPAGVTADVISLDDIYANALLDYVLYRAFLKDTESASIPRAAAHLAAFTTSIGEKTALDGQVTQRPAPATGGA